MVLRRFSTARRLVLLGLMAAVLSGCGQKGKLYLPDEPPPHLQSQSNCRTPNCAAALEAPATAESEDETQEDENSAPIPEETTE